MVIATFFLVIAGGLVTSTGSALAVPDWPLSFGQVFPKMEGGVFYEHGHRLVAATVGFLTIILAIWLQRGAREPLLKKAGWIALGLVCAQGILGGVTVLLRLPAITSVGHACLGQIFFSWMCCIAAMAWSDRLLVSITQGSKFRRLAITTAGFVFFQLVVGAIFRHTGLLLHLHMLGAFLVLVHIVLLFRRTMKSGTHDLWFLRPAQFLLGIVFVQIGLGLYTWQHPTVLDATTHVALGALILATTFVFCLQSFRRVAV
jgi:cytochrome c oxidase assembly protein subunit 15